MRQFHSMLHNFRRAVLWYGKGYTFYQYKKNEYGEPTDEKDEVQTVVGIYHGIVNNFLVEIAGDGATLKNKNNKGITCADTTELAVSQGDFVIINGIVYHVTAVEPILYDDVAIAQEISLEELIA